MGIRGAGWSFALLLVGACSTARPPADLYEVASREYVDGRLEEARRHVERGVAAAPTDARMWDLLGDVAKEQKDDRAAQRAYDRAEALAWPDARPRAQTVLDLPFEGAWLVTQGPRGRFSHDALATRFAWDFQRVDADLRPAPREDSPPVAFLAFGRSVLAPADGTVERVRDGIADNLDGRRNRRLAGGNFVVIRHTEGEFSHLCHLRCGSIRVRPGDVVRRGDVVAQCGVSGNASEPHLHFVLRVGSSDQDWSVPAAFSRLRMRRDGAWVEVRGAVPQEGDLVTGEPHAP